MTRTLTWASYNKPTSITSGSTTETFIYGPSRERLQTTVTGTSGTVTTTYIDGLFEQVQDSAGNITYKHYIIAGSARVGVETVAVTSSGTTDNLSFFVQDQVGSVVAEVTEGLGGLNQQLTVYSHDPWGKARPTSGAGANISLPTGTFLPDSAVMAGQHEGFAGHEDLEDIGIVDMEGRIYDPEVGRFLSADPTVEYPDSSQGYNRYTYCNSNPLSFSDPTGYSYLGDKAQEGMHIAFYAILAYLSGGAAAAAGAAYGSAAEAGTAFGGAAITGYVSSGGDVHTAILSGLEALAFNYVGDKSGWFKNAQGLQLVERSAVEGVIGGVFSRAGGGSFGDGFIGAFVGSETSNVVDDLAPNNEAERMAISAMIGGTAAGLSGGNFTTGAISAAMQRLFNDEGGQRRQLTAEEGQKIDDKASGWVGTPYAPDPATSSDNPLSRFAGGNAIKGADGGADCSGAVWAIYKEAGYSYTYENTQTFARNAEKNGFIKVDGSPQPGDVLLFEHHMSIYRTPQNGDNAWSALSTGKFFKAVPYSWFGNPIGIYRMTTPVQP